ncbi:MAG: hypothetical protein ACTSXP_00395 [Promethearchaeota archaeon]
MKRIYIDTNDKRLDIFPFREIALIDPKKHTIEIWWADPRDIEQIVIKIDSSIQINTPDIIKAVDYWRSTWPTNRPCPNMIRGSGRSGWQRQDDLFRGFWQKADVLVSANRSKINIKFNDLSKKEIPGEKYSTFIRRSLKIRIRFDPDFIIGDSIKSCQIFTTTVLHEATFCILCDPAKTSLHSTFSIELFNGFHDDGSIKKAGCEFGSIYTIFGEVALHPENFDGTLVTVRNQQDNSCFTFSLKDLEKEHSIALPDLGYAVVEGKQNQGYDGILRSNLEGKTVLTQVDELPTRRLKDALNEFEGKKIFYAVIGCEGVRAKAAVLPEGFISVGSRFIRKVPRSDTPRIYWKQEYSQWQFLWGIDQEINDTIPKWLSHPKKRGYVENLPIFSTTWTPTAGKIEITQEVFATPVDGTRVGKEPEGDTIPIALMKHCLYNIDSSKHIIHFQLRIGELSTLSSETLVLDSLFPRLLIEEKKVTDGKMSLTLRWFNITTKTLSKTLASSIEARLSILVATPRFLPELSTNKGILNMKIELKPHHQVILEWKIPFLHIDDINLLDTLDFEREKNLVQKYWKNRLQASSKMEIPEQELELFYEKHLWHMLITNDREIGSNRIMGRVGSMGYGCYANEVCMVTIDLDRRGMFDVARRMLETFIHYQGTVGLDGDYEDMDGIYFGAGGYERGAGYNQNQGFVLWALAEHALLSHDFAWFKAQIPSILKACEWIISERKGLMETMESLEHKRWNLGTEHAGSLGRGLLPPGGVEDITDYWFWFSTNAYNYYGLYKIAQVLELIKHPEAKRMQEAAKDYKQAILENLIFARNRNPVIKLRNGAYVPHIPCHVHRRGRGFGWIQEVLEGAIHLIRTELIPIHSIEARWILEDLEDNCYLSHEFGYPFNEDEFQKYWYTRGGFSMQPFLLCNHAVYGMMNEIKPFIRALFNSFSAVCRQDTKMFTEHPLPTMFDWFGHSFKTSDEAQCTSCLRMMFCHETTYEVDVLKKTDGESKFPDTLRLLGGIPDYWYESKDKIRITNFPTYFGIIELLIVDKTKLEFRLNRTPSNYSIPLKFLTIHLRNPRIKFRHLVMIEGKSQIQEIKEDLIIIRIAETSSLSTLHLRLE